MKPAEPEYTESQTKKRHWAIENAAAIGILLGILLGIIIGIPLGKLHQSIMVLMVTGLTIGTLVLTMTSADEPAAE